jgi:hypothetical protein
MRMSKKKQRLYNKARTTNKQKDWENFKQYQKLAQKKQRQNYWAYQNNMFDETDKSNKAFWKFIKSKRQDATSISSLREGSKVIFDSKGKAGCFNDQSLHLRTPITSPTLDVRHTHLLIASLCVKTVCLNY